jgi:hypothetical protein
MGVRNLLNEVLKDRQVNWILYDRNPDLFVDGFNNPVHKDRIWGNSFCRRDPQCLDLALIAGTPEWMGQPLTGFYRAVIDGHLPLVVLGVGYIDASITFTDEEVYCLRNQSKVISVRDEYASRALNEIGVSHEILPCPAMFASTHETVPAGIEKIGFIIQTDKTVNQSVPEELSHACAYTVKRLRDNGLTVEVICHYIDEFVDFSRTLAPVRYSYEAYDYIDIVNDYDLIISTRLHGAVLANSLGKPAILVSSGDSRLQGCASLFPFIHISRPDSVIADIDRIDISGLKNLPDWKAQVKDKYLRLLQRGLVL